MHGCLTLALDNRVKYIHKPAKGARKVTNEEIGSNYAKSEQIVNDVIFACVRKIWPRWQGKRHAFHVPKRVYIYYVEKHR